MRFRLLWAGLAWVNLPGAVAHAADALRGPAPDVSDGWITAPLSHGWLWFAIIATLILLVVRAAARRDRRLQAAADTSYRYLFESSPMPMWVMDEGTRRIVEVNETAIRRYGYSRDEFLSLTAVDLQVPEDRMTFAQQLSERDSVDVAHQRRRHITKGGETIIADVTARPFVFRGRSARLVLVNDVTTQVRAEEELRESEQRYRDLFERSPIPMWVYDAETLRFLAVNEAAVRRYGYTRQEFAHLTIADLHVPDAVPALLERARTRAPDAMVERHAGHRHRSGTVIEVDIRSGPIVFGGRRARQVLAHDITDRVRMERALREGEERLRTISDNVPALIGYIDADQRYRFTNRTYENWFGLPAREFIGQTIREVVGDAHYANIRSDVETALAGHTVTVERPLHGGTGREIFTRITYIPHFTTDGKVLGFYVLGYDITEHRQAEEARARERALLRAVVDHLPDNVYVKDRETRYLLMNPAGLAARGAKREEDVLGKTAAAFYPAETAAMFDAEDREVMASGEPLLVRERVATTEDGEKTWYLGTKVALRDGEGKVIGIVGIGRDITELRRGAETIRRLNAELEQRVRERTAQLEAANRELEAFSYSVSHDLKAPLRSIEGFGKALLEDYVGKKLDAQGRDFLNRLHAASQRMGELIDDLLALSRVTRSEMVRVPINLSAMAEEIAGDLKKSAARRKVRIAVAGDLVVHGDPQLIRVALENLLTNAWKFTSGKEQAEIEVGATRQSDGTAYFVRDNGAGFDMAYASRLFTAFQRLHGAKEFPGTGVGLATVQRVIYRHGGKVWAEGAVDRGATFYFTLP